MWGCATSDRRRGGDRDVSDWDQFGADYDFPDFDGQPNTYVIASTPRSGSHYFGHLLRKTGALGSPLEYFHPGHIETWKQKLGVSTLEDLIACLFRRRTSPNGWFGAKAHWSQFESVLQNERAFQAINFSRYIHIIRRDRLAQAISLVVARQTASWISFHAVRRTPEYDFGAIQTALSEIDAQSDQWERFFSSRRIDPMIVEYEALLADPEEAVTGVLAHVGHHGPTTGSASSPEPQRQSSDINVEWRERYLADLNSTAC